MKVVETIIDVFIKPELEKINSQLDLSLDLFINDVVTSAYKKAIEKNYNSINNVSTLVFPNIKKSLDEIYVPLHILIDSERSRMLKRTSKGMLRYKKRN